MKKEYITGLIGFVLGLALMSLMSGNLPASDTQGKLHEVQKGKSTAVKTLERPVKTVGEKVKEAVTLEKKNAGNEYEIYEEPEDSGAYEDRGICERHDLSEDECQCLLDYQDCIEGAVDEAGFDYCDYRYDNCS